MGDDYLDSHRQSPRAAPPGSDHARGFLAAIRAQRVGLALAALVLLLAVMVWGVSQYMQAEQRRAEEDFVNAPGVKPSDFQPTGFQPDAQGTIYIDPKQTRAFVIVAGLKPLPPNRVYEVWLLKGNIPVGVGTLTVDAQGNAHAFVNAPEPLARYQVSALSEEPQGGSPQPTTAIFLVTEF